MHAGEIGREMYIVEKGTLEVIHPSSGKIVKTLGKGAWFGELAILAHAGARRSMHIRAKSICEPVTKRFAGEHFHTLGAESGVGHRPAQGPSAPSAQVSAPL